MKKVELLGCSEHSWEDATRQVLAQSTPSAFSRRSIQINRFEVVVEEGAIARFCVWAEVSDSPAVRNFVDPARILVVDDLELITALARSALEKAGHDVTTAADGAEALAMVQEHPFDLILMDITMPVMDGIATTIAIRALDHPNHSIPIVAMTTNVGPEHIKKYRAAGMNDHVAKPLKTALLLQKLSELLPPTATRNPSAPPMQETDGFDLATFLDLRATMGSERVNAWLGKFLTHLAVAFPERVSERPDVEQSARDAHGLVAHAALLGFPDLSQLCGDLELAISDVGDVEPAREKAAAAARLAEIQVREIMRVAPSAN